MTDIREEEMQHQIDELQSENRKRLIKPRLEMNASV